MIANQMFHEVNLRLEGSRLFNRVFNEREIQDFLNKAQLEIIKQRFAAFRNSKGIGMGNKDIPQANIVRASELSGLLSGTAKIGNDKMIKGSSTNGALRGADQDAVNYIQEEDNYGVFVPLPNEALYVLSENVDTVFGSPSALAPMKRNVPIREVSYEEYMKGIYDAYARPYANLVWSMDWGSYTASTASTGSFVESTKNYSTTGSGFNMSGFAASDGTTLININTDRSRYLIPGKDWFVKNYQCSFLKKPSQIVVDLITPSNQKNCQLGSELHSEIVDLAVQFAAQALVPAEGKYQVSINETQSNE